MTVIKAKYKGGDKDGNPIPHIIRNEQRQNDSKEEKMSNMDTDNNMNDVIMIRVFTYN